MFFSKANILLFADFILFNRVNVGIIEKDRVINALMEIVGEKNLTKEDGKRGEER